MEEANFKVGQRLKLILESSLDLNMFSGGGVTIKYQGPNGTVQEVTALTDNMPEGAMYYIFSSEITEKGIWRFWGYGTFDSSGGTFIPGDTVELMFINEGE